MRRTFLVLLAGALAAACGGGGDFALGPNDGGVGSGGTGAIAVVASGAVEGFGSIIVNGTRYDTDRARFELRDTPQLKLGMTVQVTGTVSADGSSGTAELVASSAQLRGAVLDLDLAGRTFRVSGVRVVVDDATAFGNPGGLAALANALPVQVWGLRQAGGLLATRIERPPSPNPQQLLTDAVRELDPVSRTFRIGSLLVRYQPGDVQGGWPGGGFASDQLAQVRGQLDGSGTLIASRVEPAQPAPPPAATVLSLSGSVSQWDGQRFRLDAYTVDSATAQLRGGGTLRDGARVDVLGTVRDGVLVADRIRVRGGPSARASSAAGAGGGTDTASDGTSPTGFSAAGTVAAFRSDADFMVQGQAVDASSAQTQFIGGTRRDLQAGRKVQVRGARVEGDVLIAEVVVFTN